MNPMACSAAQETPVPAPTTMALIIDVAGFEGWLRAAHPGSRITLHRGHLCVDRALRPDAPNDADSEACAALNRLADRAMRAAEQGLVHLVQQRHGPEDFSYLAIRTRTPAKRRREAFPFSNRRRTA